MKVVSLNKLHHILTYGNVQQEYINYTYLDALKLFIKELRKLGKQNKFW